MTHRLRIVCQRKRGDYLSHPEVVSLFGDDMASLGFELTGYIIHENICTFFMHPSPTDETPTKLLLYWAQRDLHGYSMHVYHEPIGGGSEKILVIPPEEIA